MAAKMTAPEDQPMSVTKRFMYAFAVGVVAVGVGTVSEMMLAGTGVPWRIGEFIFSPYFFVPVVVVAYLIAPRLARRMRLG
jgi:hypothetical protein